MIAVNAKCCKHTARAFDLYQEDHEVILNDKQ